MSNTMSVSELAQILFTTALQQSDRPTADQVRTAIEARLSDCSGDVVRCTARVAQEAGDHPEAYAARMRWALGLCTECAALSSMSYQLAA